MNLSNYNKTFDIKRRTHSRSGRNYLELPQINKTIDLSSNPQTRPTFLQHFQWVLVDQDYHLLNEQEIYNEYHLLRKQIFRLNDLVVQQLQKVHKKASRKRIITYTEPQKINQLRQKEIQNNTFILGMMSKQYKGLKVKSQTLQPKQALEQQIQQVKQQIYNTKHQIASLKLKNKSIGDSIINTDQVIANLKQTERQYEVWNKKKKQLQFKNQKVNTQTQNLLLNLNKITIDSSSAQNYFKSQQQNQLHQIQKNTHLQAYNQKLYSLQVLKKNHEIFSALKQQKYHQLLKLLEGHVERDQKMNSRAQEIDYSLIEFTTQVQSLERKLKDAKHKHSTLGFYQSSNLDQSPERSIDSDQSFSKTNINPNPRLSMFIQKRNKNTSGQKTSAHMFVKNQMPVTAHQKGYEKAVKAKINSEKKSQLRINLSENLESRGADKVKQEILIKKQIGGTNKKDVSRKTGKEQKDQNGDLIDQRLGNREPNVYEEGIELQEQKSTEQETQVIAQKDSIKQFQEGVLDKKSIQKIINTDQFREDMDKEQRQKNQEQEGRQTNEQQYRELSGVILQMINQKVEKPDRLEEKVTIDLEKIEQNLEKVSRSRKRVKEQLTSNFNKYMNTQLQSNSPQKVTDL